MILVIDNFDSFTYNLVHLFYSLGPEVTVVRNNEISATEAVAATPEAIVISPGPGRPAEAGNTEEIIRAAAGKIPLLGVCLGHQAIGEVFGARVIQARRLMHGKLSRITHDGKGIFTGLRDGFKAVRYHSLALEEATLPPALEISARADDGEIMGICHREFPIESVQYHPESIMTTNGRQQLANFLKLAGDFNRREGRTC